METSMQRQGKLVVMLTTISGVIGVPLGVLTLNESAKSFGLLPYIAVVLISTTALGTLRLALYLDKYFPDKPKESVLN